MTVYSQISQNNWPSSKNQFDDYLVLNCPFNQKLGLTDTGTLVGSKTIDAAKTFTVNGNASISSTQSKYYGSSGYFDGTGDYLTSSATAGDMTVGSGAFTMEFWGYFNSFVGSPIVLSAGTGGFSLGVNSSGQIIMYRNGAGGWGGTWTATTLVTGQWYHIAAVTSSGAGGVWTVYLNGTSQGTASGWAGEGSTSPLYIGGYGNGVGTQLPNAYLNDIRIYKGIAKYTGNFTPPGPILGSA